MTDSAAVHELQIKVAFLEHANSELSDALYAQQRVFDGFVQRLAALEAELARLREAMMRS